MRKLPESRPVPSLDEVEERVPHRTTRTSPSKAEGRRSLRARREEDQTELEPGKGRAVTGRKRWEGASSCRASDQQARKTKRAQATDSDIVPVELKS